MVATSSNQKLLYLYNIIIHNASFVRSYCARAKLGDSASYIVKKEKNEYSTRAN